MTRIVRLYLYFLPFYSLTGIILSTLRTAYQSNYVEIFLIIGASLDAIIILSSWKTLFNRTIAFVLIALLISLIVGMLINEPSRRFITDFTNPFFFFAKIFIFRRYWLYNDFSFYLKKFYIPLTFWGSIVLLPLVYLIFSYTGSTRLAIFPPMELPFSYYMQSGGMYLYLTLLVILLYGKRAQLFGAILTFFTYIILFRRAKILKYSVIAGIGFLVLSIVFDRFSDNYAIQRLSYTLEQLAESDDNQIERVAGSRSAEVDAILMEMDDLKDYVFGKGLGFVYYYEFNEINKMQANAHFTPLALLSKYGVVFTFFFYAFLLKILLKRNRNLIDRSYLAAVGTGLFILFESLFSYTVFVLPIFPIILSYLLVRQKQIIYK